VIDGGLILMMLGALGMGIGPIEAAFAHRRWIKSMQHAAHWLNGIPVVPSDPALDRMIEQIDR
jgi:hypothetical protein